MMLVEAFERLLDVLWANDVITTQDKELIRGNQFHGEWIAQDEFEAYFKCSNCGIMIDNDFPIWRNFCPNCGASMSANDSQVTGKLNSEIEKSKSEIVPDYRDGWRLKEGDEK